MFASERGLSAVVGVLLLTALTVVAAASLGSVLVESGQTLDSPAPSVVLSLSATADTGRVALTHRGGDTLPVASLRVRVTVDGVPLEHQPPVPFFAARGFRSGPTGPFNSAADGRWTAGETAAFRLASTNHPPLEPGRRLTVRVYASGRPVAELSTRL